MFVYIGWNFAELAEIWNVSIRYIESYNKLFTEPFQHETNGLHPKRQVSRKNMAIHGVTNEFKYSDA